MKHSQTCIPCLRKSARARMIPRNVALKACKKEKYRIHEQECEITSVESNEVNWVKVAKQEWIELALNEKMKIPMPRPNQTMPVEEDKRSCLANGRKRQLKRKN